METWQQQSFDAIIIGSGPGGATVANELSKRGKRSLILEWGKASPIKGTISQSAGMALIPGQSLLFTSQFHTLVRGITLGGSSIIAYASAFEPPHDMFEAYGIDLRREAEEAKRDLPIAPLSDDLIGPAAKRIMRSAQALGFSWDKLPKIVYQDNCRLDCDKCTMGCPYGAKWTARMFVEQATARGSLLLTGARVERIETSKSTANPVVFSMGGNLYQVYAPIIVLAAGGIGTPLVLRSSGIHNAGFKFFFDPLIIVNGSVEDLDVGREFPMAAGFQDKEEGYILTDLVWPGWIYRIFTAQVFRLDRLASHRRTLPIMVKIKDELGGQITDRGVVKKQLGEVDRMRLDRGCEKAEEILRNAGAHHIYRTWYTATHPGGTAKIGDVVDSNLKTKLDNLYVCDCSVIPQAWGLPPTLTLISLGKRLAKHLIEEL